MAAINWSEVRGQKFEDEVSREASDFEEVLINFGLDPHDAFVLLKKEALGSGKRLYFSVKALIDDVAEMLFSEKDDRIRSIIQSRLQEERTRASGGVIC